MKNLWIFLGFLSLLSPACTYIDALTEEGEEVRKEIEIGPFERIVLDTSVRLVLTNDSLDGAIVEGPDFVLSRLNIFQKEEVLHVETDGFFGFRKAQMPQLTLNADGLQQVRSNFPVEISNTDTLEIENLRVVVSGRGSFTECDLTLRGGNMNISAYGSNVGDHRLSGKVEKLVVVSEGLTSVDASELVARVVNYRQSSVNPGFVHATEKLTVNMLSSGNLYYRGDCDVQFKEGDPLYKVELGELLEMTD